MGVIGLATFFASQDYVTEEFELKNSSLVIDGSNLCHYLYRSKQLPWMFGGHYDTYHKQVVKFFNNLKLSEVNPIVLFDGCYEPNQQKFRTIRERRSQRLRSLRKLNQRKCHGTAQGIIPPLLLQSVFVDCLQELNIAFLQCPLEADHLIASLANALHCPVLSQDSDFYIFPLTAGFIPLDTLQWKRCTPSMGLSCALYHQKNVFLTGNVPMDPQFMPLFASLMGNDYVRRSDLGPFLSHIDIYRKPSSHVPPSRNYQIKMEVSRTKRAGSMIKLLEWLNQFSSVTAALNSIETFLSAEKRVEITSRLHLSLQQYSINPVDGQRLKNYFSNIGESGDILNVLLEQECNFLQHYSNSFRVDCCQLALPSWLLNALNNQHTFSPFGVENVNRTSVFQSLFSLREKCYQAALFYLHNSSKEKPLALKLTEEDIDNGSSRKSAHTVEPFSSEDVQLPMSLDAFLQLLQLPETLRIEAWKCAPGPKPEMHFIILLAFLFKAHLSSQSTPRSELYCLALMLMLLLSCNVQLPAKSIHSHKFSLQQPDGTDLDVDIVHQFNVIQMIHWHSQVLATVLGVSWRFPTVRVCLNDYFFYHICSELFHRRQPLLFAQDMCGGRHSPASKCLLWLIKWICPEFVFSPINQNGAKKNKSKKSKDKKTKTASPNVSKQGSSVNSPQKFDDYCDPNNRFSILS